MLRWGMVKTWLGTTGLRLLVKSELEINSKLLVRFESLSRCLVFFCNSSSIVFKLHDFIVGKPNLTI